MVDGRIIGLISGKGGVGKTSLTANLGVSLRDLGKEVTIVDTDFAASNLGVFLGKYDHPVKIQHVLQGDAEPETAVFRHPSGVKAITSSNEINYVEPDLENLREVLEHAAEESDYVLVDCPPGLDQTVENIMQACDELMIVTMPTQTSGVNAAQIIEKAKEMRVPILGTVVNKVAGDPEIELVEREVEMMTESHILQQIPHDETMRESLFENKPIVEHKPLAEAALEIKDLAATVEGERYEKPKFAGFKRKLQNLKENIQG
jgi:septum site-determining protein MinD